MSRNLIEYPITTDEIIAFLRVIIEQDAKLDTTDGPIGNQIVSVLNEAIRRLREQRQWCVTREDIYGTRFVVRTGLSQTDAHALADLLASRGHKQVYAVQEG